MFKTIIPIIIMGSFIYLLYINDYYHNNIHIIKEIIIIDEEAQLVFVEDYEIIDNDFNPII